MMRLVPFSGARYDVRDKVVLITGAGQGIGLALAEQLAARGALLALIDVNPETLAVAAEQFDRALTVSADVRDREAMAAAVERTLTLFGHVDVVVANAGVTPPPATLRTIDLDAFDRVIAINQGGVLNTVRPALEQIIANKGHVVVVSSCAAFSPGPGGASYMMSKAAVEQFGRALRLELAPHGATAGVAYFGVVDTELAHNTLDDDPLGKRVGNLLPWPLSRRISAEQAARTMVDAIAHRSASTIAPAAWLPYPLLRGVVNVVIDSRLVADKQVHQLLRDVEKRKADTP
jgi:NAD(P)-dependent dehydrogenase (short-subunit alcohol dehydrogenase family)